MMDNIYKVDKFTVRDDNIAAFDAFINAYDREGYDPAIMTPCARWVERGVWFCWLTVTFRKKPQPGELASPIEHFVKEKAAEK